jgi:HAMP domain-containing protein
MNPSRNTWVLGVCVAGLALVAVGLGVASVTRGALDAVGLLALAGMTSFVGAGVLVLADVVRPRPRPEPRTTDGATVVDAAPVAGRFVLLGALGLALLCASMVLEDGLVDLVRERRRGLVLGFAVVLSPVLLGWALWFVTHRDRVVLTRAAVSVRRGGRTTTIPWERLGEVEALEDSPAQALRLRRQGARAAVLPARTYGPSRSTLAEALAHYRDHPRARDEIGTAASLERLRS